MSEENFSQKIGRIASEFRRPHDELLDDAKRAAKLIHTTGELAAAKGVMAEIIQFAMDERLSIDDRVKRLDMMLVLMDSLPHAKPDNSAWDEAYTGFNGLMQFWEMYKSQRFFFSDYAMAEVREFEEKKVKEKDDEGREKTVNKSGWRTHTVDPTTALEMSLVKPPIGKQATDTWNGKTEIIGTVRNPIPAAFEDMAFTKEFAEWCVKSFGEVVVIRTMIVLLNYAYNEFNVPPNAIIMLSGIMQSPVTNQPPTRESGLGLDDAARRFAEQQNRNG